MIKSERQQRRMMHVKLHKFKLKLKQKIYLAILAGIIGLNVAAWCVPAFCDWYIAHIFPIWVNTYGRFTGLFPFSVGELLLIAGVLLVVAALLLGLVLLMTLSFPNFRKNGRKKLAGGAAKFYQGLAWILLGVLLVTTLNYTLLYHGSGFNEKYLGIEEREYTFEELLAVRNYVVCRCNELSAVMERDENGDIVYDGDMAEEAILQMQNLGETYTGLRGFYPRPKPLIFSDFMCQQYMQGYYFPFSMEANYNDVMYLTNKPATLCHELAHLKGFIYEDDANFVGFLACISSEDVFFEYSGYLSVLYYLDNDFYDAIGGNIERYREEEQILSQVHADNIFVKQEEWDRINDTALIDTEVVDAVSDSFIETSLKLNGVEDGMISYNRVVQLLLQYYEGNVF